MSLPRAVQAFRVTQWSARWPAETAWVFAPSDWQIGKGNRRVILAHHGHGGSDAWGMNNSQFDPTWHMLQAIGAGYVVVALNNMGQATFGAPNVQKATDDLYAWLVNTVLMPTPRVGVLCWSMGGQSLTWVARNRDKVAATWAWTPLVDIDWANHTAGYNAPYALGTVGYPSAYASELATAYAASTTATAAVVIPAAGSAGVALPVANGDTFADGFGPTLPQASTGGASFTFTGSDSTHLYGCVSTTAATIAVASGAAITSSFAQQYHGYSPFKNPAALRNPRGPIKIATAVDDATIPYQQSQYFVQQINDPKVTWRQVSSGGHTNLFAHVPVDEFVALYEAGVW